MTVRAKMRLEWTMLVVMGLSAAVTEAGDVSNQRLVPPEGAGYVNVQTDAGAAGDGQTDDTEALRSVISAGKNDPHPEFGSAREIYLPDGVYLVSEPIEIGDKKKSLIGESRDGVVIRLTDNAEGFEDPDNPQPVLSCAQSYEGWHFAQNFFQRLHNLTVDIGAGNPGAIGIEYHTNNGGDVFNVLIRSSDPEHRGAVGLSQAHGSGPGLIHQVTVEGFDIGMQIQHDLHSMAFSHITLRHQREVGFENRGNTVSIEQLVSDNGRPALRNHSASAHLALRGARLTGGSGGAAIENDPDAAIFVRDVQTEGYASALISGDDRLESGAIERYASPDTLALFEQTADPLALPIEPVPWPGQPQDAAGWTLVEPADDGDITEPLQQAIDDGAEYIFIPTGDLVFIRDTIHVRNNVRVIRGGPTTYRSQGFDDHHQFDIDTNAVTRHEGEQTPIWRIDDGTPETVMIMGLRDEYGDAGWAVDHASDRTLILHGTSGNYRNTVTGGRAFIVDTGLSAGSEVRGPQQVWAWHCNPESYTDQPQILNEGADLWILGIKTEKDRTIIETRNGGRTELVGGLLYKNRERIGPEPAFVIDETSAASLSYKVTGRQYVVHVQQTRDGETRELRSKDTFDRRVPLFSSGTPAKR